MQTDILTPDRNQNPGTEFLPPVELRLWTTHNSTSGTFPVFARLVFAPILVEGAGKDYKIFIRCASFQLALTGVREPDGHARYRHDLDADEVKACASQHISSEFKSGYGGEFSARFGNSLLNAAGNASASKSNQEKSQIDVSANIRFTLVEEKPNLAWRIGDPRLGDIRKSFGFLDGPYITAENGNGTQICTLKGEETAPQKHVVGTISVRDGDIHVVPDGGYASDACLETDAMRSVIDVFKDRLRSIKLMNAMNARGELTLARARMRLPDSEEG